MVSSRIIVVFLCSLVFVGCKQIGTRGLTVDYKPVSVELKFADLTGLSESAIPGSKAWFDVVVKGDNGKNYSLNDGNLKREQLIFKTKGMALMEGDNAVLFDASIADGSEYSISVEYIGYENKISIKKVFLPDFSALRGPDPENVEGLFFSIDYADAGGKPVPGRSYPFEISVTDHFRKYKTGETYPKLPLDRLIVVASGMEFDKEQMMLTGTTDEGILENGKYRVKVSYIGRPDVTMEEIITPDFASIRGPSPISIKEVMVVGDLKKLDAAIPGSEIRLDLQVKDKSGRIYRTDQEFLTIPRDRIGVRARGVDYDASTGLLKFSGDLHKMQGKQYEIVVWYRGRKSKKAKIKIAPDFVSGLPLMSQEEFIFRGANGQNGRPGKSTKEIYAIAKKSSVAKGGKIFNVDVGKDGSDGADGLHGPSITIRAQEVRSLDGKKRLIVMEVAAHKKPAKYYLRSWDQPALRIASYGGNGGIGGRGGDGSRGDENVYDDEDAMEPETPIYHGGNGGHGGKGGNGGGITLLVSNEALVKAFILESRGGKTGDKGAGGLGVDVSGKSEGAGQLPTGKPGAGRTDVGGDRGDVGKISVSVDESANEVIHQAPKEISGWIL